MSWVRRNLIGRENFWNFNPTRRGSWIWRAICHLQPMARPMVCCELGSGITASFWHDNWTSHGPLIDLIGERGPQVTRLPIDAVVADALTDDGWWLDRSRSRSPTITLLKACLPNAQGIVDSEEDDTFLWYPEPGRGSGSFSASATWRALHHIPLEVFWHKVVWFSHRVPKHAFITWIAARDRMVTRDKLIRWGLRVPASSVLCSSHEESRIHLFFDCTFSSQVWTFFTSQLHLTPPQGFEAILR